MRINRTILNYNYTPNIGTLSEKVVIKLFTTVGVAKIDRIKFAFIRR